MFDASQWTFRQLETQLNPQRTTVTLQDTSLLLPRFGCCVWTPLPIKWSFPHPLLFFNNSDERPLAKHPCTRCSAVHFHALLTPPYQRHDPLHLQTGKLFAQRSEIISPGHIGHVEQEGEEQTNLLWYLFRPYCSHQGRHGSTVQRRSALLITQKETPVRSQEDRTPNTPVLPAEPAST